MKICTRCREEKHESEFHTNRPDCKDCRRLAMGVTKRVTVSFVAQVEEVGEVTEKRCTACGVRRETRDFYKDCSRCKLCKKSQAKLDYLKHREARLAYTKKWQSEHPEQVAEYNKKRGRRRAGNRRGREIFQGR